MTTLQIKPGHYYRTRGMGIVGPMHRRGGPGTFPWCMSDSYPHPHSCMDDGRYHLEGDPSTFDIVEDLGTTNPHVIG